MTTFNPARINRELDERGVGHRPVEARRLGLPRPVVVFVRNDDWCLGAGTPDSEREAFEMWAGYWTHYARQSEGWELKRIALYKDPGPCSYCGQDGHNGGCKAHERHDARCL